ncbi:hypothetical protein BpHYR1_052295 [Brachionus plicatilis]|uniref:Secreted protein n=1 Tax=Brachionus plicatilis TaxID=10195 RepID=A0A3M7QTL4_BRAPC|nr:hypothetical protein BpHYR1_052295 [Brachionus plicatilis]
MAHASTKLSACLLCSLRMQTMVGSCWASRLLTSLLDTATLCSITFSMNKSSVSSASVVCSPRSSSKLASPPSDCRPKDLFARIDFLFDFEPLEFF